MSSTIESCEVCGFVWDEPDLSTIAARLLAAGTDLSDALTRAREQATLRPSPDVWSPVEYGAHTRDVLLNLRDRLIVGLAEDNPTPKPMYGTLRIERGMYDGISGDEIAQDLRVAIRLFVATISTLSEADGARPIHYGWPRPATRTLRWVAAQALHEVEHHAEDVVAILEPHRT